MSNDPRLSEDPEVDSTDTLPLLGSEPIVPDASDASVAKFAFTRTATLDLPRLAKSLRSVEASIEQQSANHAALARSFERTLEMEEAAVARASALSAELAAARNQLEHARAAQSAAELRASEKGAAFDALHMRLEEAAREVAFHAGEARSLRELIATRDAAIAKALDGLRERDAEVAALRAERGAISAMTSGAPPAAVAAEAPPAAPFVELPLDADTAALRERIAEQERRLAAQAGEIASLQAAAITDQEEKAVLLAHLQVARHAPSASGAPAEEPRDALLLRLERSEVHSARLLERLDDAIERLNARAAASALESSGAPAAPATGGEGSGGKGSSSNGAPIAGAVVPDFHGFLSNVLAPSPQDELADAGSRGTPASSVDQCVPVVAPVAGLSREESLHRSGDFNAFAAAFESDAGPDVRTGTAGTHGAFTEVRPLAQLLRTDDGASQAYPLHGRMLVGRSPDAELHIDSSTVSRQHATLECDSFGVLIEDTQSTNGTYVNGARVRRQRLRNGDQVKIGEASFRFVAAKTGVSTH